MGEVIKMEKTVSNSALKLDKNGIPVSNSIYNVKTLLLKADVFAYNLAFNEFTQEPELINDFYLHGTLLPKRSIKPSFEDILSEYFETELDVVFKPTAITGALNIFWDTKKYNPVKAYMEQAIEDRRNVSDLLRKYLLTLLNYKGSYYLSRDRIGPSGLID